MKKNRSKRGDDQRTKQAGAGQQQSVERLRRRFEKFRREHRSRARIPYTLRQATLAAVAGGVSEAEVQRTCGVTSHQLAQWRRGRETMAGDRPTEEARVYPVVDGATAGASPVGGDVADLRLQLGGWRICIRQVGA